MGASPPRRGIRVAIVAASMRILGGHAVQAQRMLDGWAQDDEIAVWLVPIDPLPHPRVRPLLKIKFVRTLVTELCYLPLLVREIRRADAVHIFSAAYTSFLLAPLPAIAIAKAMGRPVILNYHSGEAADHLRRSPLARFVMRRAVDVIVVPSPFLRDIFARFGLDARVVPNAIDTVRFAYRPRDPIGPRLLSTRNFEPLYNVACTLRAFERVQARYPTASLTLVGSGSQDAALRALADRLRLRNVTFAGRVDPIAIAQSYADADIYVQTPTIDNMPLSVLEAFASGLPVVSTCVGGVPDIVAHGVHGLLAPSDDDAAVAAAVIALVEDAPYARRLAAVARDSCAAYEWPLVARAWRAVYRSLVSFVAPSDETESTRAALQRSESA